MKFCSMCEENAVPVKHSEGQTLSSKILQLNYQLTSSNFPKMSSGYFLLELQLACSNPVAIHFHIKPAICSRSCFLHSFSIWFVEFLI